MSDIERLLLGKLRSADDVRDAWNAGVRPDALMDPMCRSVYAFTLDYWRDSRMTAVPTRYAITEEFPGWEHPQEPEETLTWIAERLRRRYSSNQLHGILRTAAEDIVTDPTATLQELYRSAYAASEVIAPSRARLNTADTIDERRQRYGERQNDPDGQGATHGLDFLDVHTGGIFPGELAIIGGFAKTGKSFWLVNAAVRALRKGQRPLLVTLEMKLSEMEDRIDALSSGVGYNELVKGTLTMEDVRRLHRAQEDMRELGGIHVESPEIGDRTVTSICARAREIEADYLIIDQLSFMEPGRKVQNLKEHHGFIVADLKREIGRHGQELSCLLAVQLNRNSNDAGVSLQSFSNATEIEQTADIALGLSRTNEQRRNSAMKLTILGSRRSDTAKYMLNWTLMGRSEISFSEEIID